MTPKIDYKLLGRALAEYECRGYTYVEVPWAVEQKFIEATLPWECDRMILGRENGRRTSEYLKPYHRGDGANQLVGSAEQGFLSLNLGRGAYVGITPCFRIENIDLMHRDMFMKVELFVVGDKPAMERVLYDASEVMALLGGVMPTIRTTDEGADLEIAGIEVGSYGERQFEDQKWVYGTGLALPRFSVARAIDQIT